MTRRRPGADSWLKALRDEFGRLRKRLQALHRRTGYEDLGHGVLALEIAGHAVTEALEHTGLGGEIRATPNPTAHRQARRWHETVKDMRGQAGKFLRTHPSEDLETALKALEIAAGSLEEVVERYE
jgi:hypothetical protein